MSEEYLTADEAAQRLRVHGDTIRDWCRTGQLRATKVGKQWRIRPTDLDSFMKPNREEAKKVDALALSY